MSSNDKILAESIRSGKYFEESRRWFRTVYIGPVSERTFFLVIAVLSALVAFGAVSALVSLMPLHERKRVLLYANERQNETVTSLVALKSPGASLNTAIKEFYVTSYVKARETYFASTYLSNARYIQQQSSDAVYAAYLAQQDVSNPTSPAAMLGRMGQRILTIHSVNVSSSSATIKFSTDIVGAEGDHKTRWTARMDFGYTGMDVGEQKNPETGEIELKTTDPKFQVVKYELEQN
jgi:type IV secretion system protein VirB8